MNEESFSVGQVVYNHIPGYYGNYRLGVIIEVDQVIKRARVMWNEYGDGMIMRSFRTWNSFSVLVHVKL